MFFRKKPKRDPNPNVQWVNLIVIGIIAIAIISNVGKRLIGEPAPMVDSVEQATANLAPEKLVDVKALKSKIFPGYKGELRISDIVPGQGMPAICGQQATIRYVALLEDGTTIDSNTSLSITIGEAMPAFNQGIIGMKAGGKRTVHSPPAFAYGAPGFTSDTIPGNAPVRFEIELLSASGVLPAADSTPYRVSDTSRGSGSPFECGKSVSVHLTIWSVDGKKLYASKDPIQFTPGKSEVMMGIEEGVLGMQPGGTRTLIVPPLYQKTVSGKPASVHFPVPVNQTVLVDIAAIP